MGRFHAQLHTIHDYNHLRSVYWALLFQLLIKMAPLLSSVHMPNLANHFHGHLLLARSSSSDLQLRTQWQNPSDILSLLLLLAPDVIQRSIAQLNGRGLTPVAFSFGWVAYSVSALLSTVGGIKFAPSKKKTIDSDG